MPILEPTTDLWAAAGATAGEGGMLIDVEGANRTAVERMTVSRPRLVGLETAGEAIPWLAAGNRLLHAGPPIGWERASGPLQGAVIGAALLEGWAGDEEEAAALAAGGGIELEPCHHHAAVGPMAGVVSPSMALYVVEDAAGDSGVRRTFSTLNEGYGKVLRYGAYAPEVLDRLRWMNGELAGLLGDALAAATADDEPLDLRTLAAEALHMGDEGHNRNKAGSLLFTRWLAPRLIQAAGSAAGPRRAVRALAFLGDNALSVLNPLMAACKAMADAAHGVAARRSSRRWRATAPTSASASAASASAGSPPRRRCPTASTSPASRPPTPTRTSATRRSPRRPASAASRWRRRRRSSPSSAADRRTR